ncbi:ada regulatory alkA domain protein [Mycobacterium kansasii]|uniref:Ada regulatory alkA domain protein n=1 Tax=Mycobacterium kansasii TaxID=1768 RepID=A0A1V3XGC4_MYCKA|nr:ada regulatory alkA domain protein [Mycobacterium kansasii]
MRGLGDPDAFPAGDLGVRLAARQLGLPNNDAHFPSEAPGGDPGGHMPHNICGPRSSTR